MSMGEKIKIFIVDDHQIMVDGLIKLISEQDNLFIAGFARNSIKALQEIEIIKPDVVVCDISLEEKNSGISLIKIIKQLNKDIKVIALSMHEEDPIVLACIKNEVNAYVLKSGGAIDLLKAIDNVCRGAFFISNNLSGYLIKNLNKKEKPLLTTREVEVLKLIAKEYTNSAIAEELCISIRTVETHRKNIFIKTNSKTAVGLINYSHLHNLI
jgi:two-component system, NarL family, nitrate/nitrite response regulator NarL